MRGCGNAELRRPRDALPSSSRASTAKWRDLHFLGTPLAQRPWHAEARRAAEALSMAERSLRRTQKKLPGLWMERSVAVQAARPGEQFSAPPRTSAPPRESRCRALLKCRSLDLLRSLGMTALSAPPH